MLVGLTRIGASTQTIAKPLVAAGADPALLARAERDGALRDLPLPVALTDARSGLITVTGTGWLGSRAARDEAFATWAATTAALDAVARRCGGHLVAPGVSVGGAVPLLAGDRHVAEVCSPVEQEVLVNLLRIAAPTLIALAGRGVARVGGPVDAVGSRRLSESRQHLATRYLTSTAPAHLARVALDLRRRHGVAHLEWMDVAPTGAPDRLSVTVRCLDAAATLAAARAHALLVAALALRARRRIRAGGRVGHAPQRRLEDDRARAVTYGLRAHRVEEDGGAILRRSGEEAARRLLADVAVELRNLEAGADELAPLLLPVEYGTFGGRPRWGERTLVDDWAALGPEDLVAGLRDGLLDPQAGGPLLTAARRDAPAAADALALAWDERIAAAGTSTRPARVGVG